MDYEQIMTALRNAHAAGDTAAATRLAAMARAARSQTEAPSAVASNEVAAPTPPAGDALAMMRQAGLAGAESTGPSNFADMTDQIGVAGAEIADEQIGPYVDPALALMQGLTFGGSDEVLGYAASQMGRIPYAEAAGDFRGELDQFREESPLAAYGLEIGGAMALPLGGIGQTGSLPARAVQSGLLGAGQGAAYGFLAGEGNAMERAPNMVAPAVLGGAIGAAIPVAGQVISGLDNAAEAAAQTRAAARNAPTSQQLRQQAQGAYRQIDDAGVQITPEAFRSAFDDIVGGLQREGLDQLPGPGSLTPKSGRVVEIGQQMSSRMAENPTSALPFGSLDQLRRQAGNAAADSTFMGRPTPDARLGAQVISGLDDFVENLTPDQVTAGDLSVLQTMIPKAREVWARMSRSQMLDDAIDNSQNYLSGEASGLRNQFARILRNPQLRRGFDDAEIAAIRRVVNGTIPEKLLHLVGGGLGNLATIGIGSTFGPLGGLAGMGIAAGTRKASDAVASRNAEIARALIASGGLRNLDVPQLSDETRQIIEALLGSTSRAPMATAAQN